MRNEKEILEEIEAIDCKLSPENLHCDGEISHAQAQYEAVRLTKNRERLEKELGRKVGYVY